MNNGTRNMLRVALAFGALITGVLLARSPVVLLAFVAVAGFVMAEASWKVSILVIAALIPFSIGTVSGISDVLVIEALAFPTLALCVLHALGKRRSPLPTGMWRWVIVAGVFAAAGFLHAFGLVSGLGSIGNSAAMPNFRAYMDLFAACVVFLTVLYLACGTETWSDGPLAMIATVGVALGALRLISHYAGVEMTFLAGRFDYSAITSVSGVSVERIGGLTEAASLAIGGALGLLHRGRYRGLAAVAGLAGVTFALISGGRSYGLGLLIAVTVYGTVLHSGRAWVRQAALVGSGVLAAVSVLAVGLGSQLTRIAAFAGGLEAQDPARYAAMRFMWIEFLASPVFGKGIGAPGTGVADQFVAEVVSFGSHSTYLATLANFGVVGFSAIAVLLVASIVRAWRELRFRLPTSDPRSGWLVFLMFVLVTRALEFTVAGSGYNDFGFWAVAGATLALTGTSLMRAEATAEEDDRAA